MIQEQALIIGLTIGGVALLIVIIVVLICCCCRKTERSLLKRSMKRIERKYQQDRSELDVKQTQRKEELTKKHNEIREKYGLPMNSDLQPPRDNIFSVENEKVSLSLN